MKLDYSEFNENDFAADENFQQWVLSPNEENDSYWHDWLIENPSRKNYVEEARELVLLMEFKPLYIPEIQLDEIKRGYKAQIRGKEPKKHKWTFERFMKTIGAIGLLVVVSYLLTDLYHQQNNFVIYQTKKGQKLKVMLPDGSQVWLNGESTLKYPEKSEAGNPRAIVLNGEAYFDLQPKSDSAFIIETADISLSNLKGRLNISSYPEDKNIIVTLLSGKGSIQNSGEPKAKIVLKPSQITHYNKVTGKFEVKSGNVSDEYSWKDGKLIIKNQKLKLVAKKLERWYGATIAIDKGANCLLSINTENESLEEVLKQLKAQFQLAYKQQEGKIIIGMVCK